jgi:hypothetical protein
MNYRDITPHPMKNSALLRVVDYEQPVTAIPNLPR